VFESRDAWEQQEQARQACQLRQTRADRCWKGEAARPATRAGSKLVARGLGAPGWDLCTLGGAGVPRIAPRLQAQPTWPNHKRPFDLKIADLEGLPSPSSKGCPVPETRPDGWESWSAMLLQIPPLQPIMPPPTPPNGHLAACAPKPTTPPAAKRSHSVAAPHLAHLSNPVPCLPGDAHLIWRLEAHPLRCQWSRPPVAPGTQIYIDPSWTWWPLK